MSKRLFKPIVQSVVATMAVIPAVEAVGPIPTTETPTVIVSTKTEPMAAGAFEPTWQSLANYQTPEWFRDAKFGIWAHWGPQCAPRPATGMPATCTSKATGRTSSTSKSTARRRSSGSKT
ncbi:MAG: alpha-L-fucosidase [Tepidisphaeraceae bacterium]